VENFFAHASYRSNGKCLLLWRGAGQVAAQAPWRINYHKKSSIRKRNDKRVIKIKDDIIYNFQYWFLNPKLLLHLRKVVEKISV